MPNPWIIIGVLIAFGLAVAGAYNKGHTEGVQDADAKWVKTYAALEAEKDKKIAAATQRYIEAEATNLTKTQDWEKKDNEREAYIQGMRLANGRLVDATCGMFDRNGRPTGNGGGDAAGAAAGAALSSQGPPAICKFPGEVRAALQQFGRELGQVLFEADEAVLDAIAGHDLAVEIEAFRAEHMERNRETVPH